MDKKVSFAVGTAEAIKVFGSVEGEVQTILDRYRTDDDHAPSVPENLRTKTSVEVGTLLLKITAWYEDVIQPRIASAELNEETYKKQLDIVQSTLRREAVVNDPTLKKSTNKDLLKAEIHSDMRFIQATQDLLIWKSVRNHLEREGKAWYRKIETVSRIVTQQSDEVQQGRFRNRPDAADRNSGSPFSRRRSHRRES